MKKELTDMALARELVVFFGPARAARLMGYCIVLAVAGVKGRGDILKTPVVSLPTRYRILADIKAIRRQLGVLGYELTEDDQADDALIQTLGHLRLAA